MELSGKRVIVVGLGKSGLSAARLCLEKGAEVVATDREPLEKLPPSVKKLGAKLVTGGHEGVDFAEADLVVVSPGVPNFPDLQLAEVSGVEVIGEVELASRFIDVPIAAVGGTNGKSTTTVLLGHLLEAEERHTFVGGNLGDPACEAVGQELDVVVFEVSSFQMERVPTFRPRVSVLLNVSEDHLDRYPSYAAYAQAKGNAFENQQESDVAVVPHGDTQCLTQARRGRGRVVTFGDDGDFAVHGHEVVVRASGERFDLGEADLFGRHNYWNAAAAIAAADALGVSSEGVREGLRRFRALPHRMALVGRIRGVNFYDDSKATNVGAAVTALAGLTESKGVLVAGGRDKMGSYEPLVEALKKKGRAVVVMGEAATRISRAVSGVVPVEIARSMGGAVERAFRLARPGDAVLLSPACSSLDMFKSFAERGDRFSDAVEHLAARLADEEGA